MKRKPGFKCRLFLSILAAAGISAATSVPASAAAGRPAAVSATPQPAVSTSYYIYGAADSGTLAKLSIAGIDQGTQDCNNASADGGYGFSTVFLDFGAQDVSGAGTWSPAGPIGGSSTPYYVNSWIEQAVENFADGYNSEAESCPDYVGTTIGYGTNSSGETPTSAQVTVQADNWFNMAADITTAVNDYANTNFGGYSAVGVTPASDIEPSFSAPGVGEPASTVVSWASEIGTDFIGGTLPYMPQDYGSADGCPGSCPDGWTVSDLEQVAAGLQPDPQIYVAGAAQEWAAFCADYDATAGYSPLNADTILTDPDVSGFLSAADAWNDMINDLTTSGDSNCATQLPAFETFIDSGDAIS